MICCSKGRPHRLPDMLDSYHKTKANPDTDMVICLNPSDTRVKEYDAVTEGYRVMYRDPNYYTPVANEVSLSLMPEYDYYSLVDDDYLFRSSGWDTELIGTLEAHNGWGIAYCNDLWPDSSVKFRHPSVPVMSKKMIDTVGYMVLPTLNHFKIDTYMRDLTEPLGLLFFREDVIVEHMHLHNKKAPDDDSYRWSYCPEEWNHGEKEYRLWCAMQADKDRQKIANAIAKEKGVTDGRS